MKAQPPPGANCRYCDFQGDPRALLDADRLLEGRPVDPGSSRLRDPADRAVIDRVGAGLGARLVLVGAELAWAVRIELGIAHVTQRVAKGVTQCAAALAQLPAAAVHARVPAADVSAERIAEVLGHDAVGGALERGAQVVRAVVVVGESPG